MDFSLPHIHEESVATRSKIRHIKVSTSLPSSSSASKSSLDTNDKLDNMVIRAANQAAAELLLGSRVICQRPTTTTTIATTKTDSEVVAATTSVEEMEEDPTTNEANDKKENPSIQEEEENNENDEDDDGYYDNDMVDYTLVDSSFYPERSIPQASTIEPKSLVVIFESFDNLNFCYATPGDIFNNRNGNFHHDDFIGKPFGCKIRSRNNQGYGFVYLLKPTPELWARSLNHRTQIIHELDASMMVFYLNLRPNMVVCESGTGSGALSHCILRSIAPSGKLFTYEFNQARSEAAVREFHKNGVGHLVQVYHKDVCGKAATTKTTVTTTKATTANGDTPNATVAAGVTEGDGSHGGFERPQASVDALVLDLPEPWLAIPHAAYCLKPNARIACYSPCVEQSQRTVTTMRQYGFHSYKTMEFRLKEHYVDEIDYDLIPPREKRPCIGKNTTGAGAAAAAGAGAISEGEDTGAEADNEKSEYETEGDQASLATAGTFDDPVNMAANSAMMRATDEYDYGGTTTTRMEVTPTPPSTLITAATAAVATTVNAVARAAMAKDPSSGGGGGGGSSGVGGGTTGTLANNGGGGGSGGGTSTLKRKKVLVARPFVMMRGHTAFITFATAGNKPQPDPNLQPQEQQQS